MITIVMYHYVRDYRDTKYPRIRGLPVEKFEGQLQYILKHYTVVGLQEVLSCKSFADLPSNACTLTFDDGLRDHYDFVFPLLKRYGIPGSFYPVALSSEEGYVLKVHKIQHLIATLDDESRLVSDILMDLPRYRADFDLLSDEEYLAAYHIGDRYDTPAGFFAKRLLQTILPEPVRDQIVDRLFARHLSEDEGAFHKSLYLSMQMIREMKDAGMEIGGHGHSHIFLGDSSVERQEQEIRNTGAFLARCGVTEPWVLCYPYGSWNGATERVCREWGAIAGLTDHAALASSLDSPFTLPRLDTIDLPFSPDAPLSPWTRQVVVSRG